MNPRGVAAIGVLGVVVPLIGVVQRLAIAPLSRVLPPARSVRLLTLWQLYGSLLALAILRRLGGATIELPGRIPAEPGVLVLMNHQSLIDILILVCSMRGVYPKIVTRARYAAGAPTISHMVRLYRYPLVDPANTTEQSIAALREEAASTAHPLAIYPEGTRTRNGRIGRFKPLGLTTILRARRWQVYVVVVDGLWKCQRLKDLVGNVSSIRVAARTNGPYRSPSPSDDPRPFIGEMRSVMTGMLDEIRAHEGAAP